MKVEFGPEFEASLKRMVWEERLAPINPAHWYRSVRWFVQRGRRGYSDMDLWDVNDHIARCVIAFMDMPHHGYPMGLTEKKWDEYKTEIRWLMEQQLNSWDIEPEVALSGSYQDRIKRANKLFGKYWQALWD